ncbi:hypothetical protein [Streptomyces avicenniae]|uniref:hypothetical protein n=1 Tax=Streptomyces avicenniae TaxID=500153 RepID=UPI000699E0DB|nr:hypothetical protein [Streptomyces avicenniae]
MTDPVFVCGARITVLAHPTAPREVIGMKLRCRCAEHPATTPHHDFAGEAERPGPFAVWARWRDETSRPVLGELADCLLEEGREDTRRYCVLFSGHAPPCSWQIHDPEQQAESLLAALGIDWRE